MRDFEANASTLLDRWLEDGRGDATVLITDDDRQLSARTLWRDMCRVASGLEAWGVAREERVLLALDDTPVFPAMFLGAMRRGAVPVPLNFLLRAEDYGFFLDDSYARTVVVDAAYLDKLHGQTKSRAHVRLVVANAAPDLELPAGAVRFEALLGAGRDAYDPVPTHADDMAFWLYSSGSTGRPKGVVHRHADIEATCRHYAGPVTGIRRDDVVFSSTKMFHAYGLGNNLTFPLWAGATSVYLEGKTTADRVLRRISTWRPNLLFSVPALYNAMLDDPTFGDVDWSSVRLGLSAAESLPPEIWRQFKARTGVEILDGIGSTELLHIYCSNRAGACRPGTSGRPVDGYRMQIRTPEGSPCPPGTAGELWVSGPSTTSGYWHQHHRTRAKIEGEWFATGDRYRADADGYFTYEGRMDDMMKIGGLWVSPIEIENRLMEHEGVREAAVVRVQEEGRSRIGAWVILHPGQVGDEALTRELQGWCKAALQRYQFPHIVHYVADFPRTATGKIQRFKLREH